MRIAILSESETDDAVFEVFSRQIIGAHVEFVRPQIRSRGWPAVLNLLASVIKDLEYNATADLLIVGADSDNDPLHLPGAQCSDAKCRLCKLRDAVASVVVPHSRLVVAIGVAVPAIEAWLVHGADAQATEAGFRQMDQARRTDRRRQLKELVYGSSRASVETRLRRAHELASQIITDPELEANFPVGLTPLMQTLRSLR